MAATRNATRVGARVEHMLMERRVVRVSDDVRVQVGLISGVC